MKNKLTGLLVLFAVFALVGCGGGEQDKKASGKTKKRDVSSYSVPVYRTLGNPNAETVIEAFSDSQCTACRVSFPIIQAMVKSVSDKVYLKYIPVAFPQYKWSVYSAVAMECAGKQNKYFEYTSLIYEHQMAWATSSVLPYNTYLDYANVLGLDMQNFRDCFQSEKTVSDVIDSSYYADQRKINQVPTYFVNGKEMESLKELNDYLGKLYKEDKKDDKVETAK